MAEKEKRYVVDVTGAEFLMLQEGLSVWRQSVNRQVYSRKNTPSIAEAFQAEFELLGALQVKLSNLKAVA